MNITMNPTVSQIYAVRFGTKLSLPKVVQDNIARLRITPVTYKPFRPQQKVRSRIHVLPDNWREKALIDCVRRVKEYDDPEYSEIFGILNKLAPPTLDKLSAEIGELLARRDDSFRLRVVTLLFNKAINENVYASLMSDCALKLSQTIPEIREDLKIQIEMFPTLYNMTETVVFPTLGQSGFEDKIVEWSKQKDKRRGYAKFMTQLFVRSLIPESIILQSVKHVVSDLNTTARQVKTEQTEENTTHLVDFLFESGKVLPKNAIGIRTFIRESLAEFLRVPRPELSSLCMRSRFKTEDALKCVQ